MASGFIVLSNDRKQIHVIPSQSAAFSENRIFTYTNADEFSEMNESDRVITTSTTENLNPLVLAMYTRPQHRNEVGKRMPPLPCLCSAPPSHPAVPAPAADPPPLVQVMKYQTMFIMADCGEKAGTSERIEHELVVIKSFPDGSFDMRPGFSRKDANGEFIDDPYEYEDENGGQGSASCSDNPVIGILLGSASPEGPTGKGRVSRPAEIRRLFR